MNNQIDLFTAPNLEDTIRRFIYSDFTACESLLKNDEFWERIRRLSDTSLIALYREVVNQRIDSYGNDDANLIAQKLLDGLRSITAWRRLEVWG